MNYWLFIIIPLVSALIGWITIRLAIKMLFHPREPKKILGLRFHGIFPQRQQQFAEKLGKLVSKEFLSFNDIERQISHPGNLQKIMPVIENHMDDFLRHRLGVEIPMISMFIGEKTVGMLKQSLMKEIEQLFPIVMKQFALNLQNELDIQRIVRTRVAAFSSDKLEQTLYHVMSKEFRFVGIIGAVTGFMIGLIQVIIMYLAN